ncbi:hypothetical protein ACFOUP_00995 [Belliella kenyensis]|uniref:DUF4221 domain-containing protein n=1 Tax=Belliella kenyensis TaxID=1472724 RepID=A0ABV8EGB7_9BACT|nr:hypothetical protein [Belliella kenyensis]MCH7401727.1 hypothetical protein [Belliella kenyensis]MDN3604227.1 hypothetical protein [Belliella kenyensis]
MNQKHTIFIKLVIFTVLLNSCGEETKLVNPIEELSLTLVDSIVVEALSPLNLFDLNLTADRALMVGRNKSVYLTDLKGEIIKEFKLAHDGPDGVGANGAFGYKFLDDNRFVAQGFINHYFVYDFEGNQIFKSPYHTMDVHRLVIYRNRTIFHPFMHNGKMKILGEDHNFFTDDEMNPSKVGLDFYKKISNIYQYDLESEKLEILDAFPETWEPRVSERFVGSKLSMISLNSTKKSFALMPIQGSQLYIYDLGDEIELKHEVKLNHPERPDFPPTISLESSPQDYNDYPAINNVLFAGDYGLVQFFSTIPKSKMEELRAISEQYLATPEYKEASKQYIRPYYIVFKNNIQIGVINELPVDGTIESLDSDGYIYINDNISPKVERDYNVFYKVKIDH